ncbi:conserved hypothetical protein [Tenacibaculum maritimum]|uniref:hypothetical protein n=1 Tax=Tenacibaculum maritimum TaxID=107401 RepID=UPI0012E58541|nr:hypothetical protein [Tenacibaculum maritimum]CAA0163636.1 conserved hypothetical protein [Tenacibaculum maritimum]
MVRIIDYKQRQKEDGDLFYVLELQGGVELIKSKSTGNFYATAKKAYIPSTFDEQTCIALTGTEMQGSIIKEECEPYEYIVKETGEEIIMHHRWTYVPEDVVENTSLQAETLQPNVEQFSQNEALQYAS